LAEIVEIVNLAYAVETGNSGVAFKNTPRYRSLKEAEKDLNYFYIIKNECGQEIIGVVKAKIIEDFTMVDIGPFAVKTNFQVLNPNSFLMIYSSCARSEF
jgi:hypothetical protein